VVIRQRQQWTDYGDEKWDDLEVQDFTYPTKALADKRAEHLNHDGKSGYATVHPVRIYQEPQQPVYVLPPVPKMPPSAVFTAEDPGVKLQVAYDAPRRVFRQREPSMADAVSGAWASWAQTAKGIQPSDVPTPESIAQLFEESDSGTIRLYPRELPAPSHS
jgi:hypothetical protein